MLKAKAAAVVLIAVAAGFLIAGNHRAIHAALVKVLEAAAGLGAWAPVLFILIYVVECILMVPNPVITPAAGILFGVFQGALYAVTGSILGASIAFLISRHWARSWVLKKVEGQVRLRAMDEFIESEGWKIVMLTRLAPVTPFKILNYAYGVTRVGFKPYFFGSLIGIIPSAFLYAYFGSLIGDIAHLGRQGHVSPQGLVFSGSCLAATAAIVGYIVHRARKKLKALKPAA